MTMLRRYLALVLIESPSFKAAISASLVIALLCACKAPQKEPVTLTFLDPQWSKDLTALNVNPDDKLVEFTRKTGIRVKHLPAPETALDQLTMVQELLQKGSGGPDVSGVDVIWPGSLSDDLLDLKAPFASELSSVDPHVVSSFTVDGKLVAVPYNPDLGVLFYRTDLLRKYGYKAPPKNWDELEKMAAHIQQGERAEGHKDFWGFVWPGAAGEGLACNALEWQAGEGGGHIIETDHTISVNNPDAIRSWQRAAHWVGSISSPSVVSYEEWDAISSFYSKNAAFYRGWAQSYLFNVRDHPENRAWLAITTIPRGTAAQASTLGGFGLGVSRFSTHPAEATELVRFLMGREIRMETAQSRSGAVMEPMLYQRLAILKTYSDPADSGGGVVTRPSPLVGNKYGDVSRAYIKAVHSVLTGKARGNEAAAELEKELVRITGFKPRGSSPGAAGR